MSDLMKELSEDIEFLDAEINGLRARISERDGAAKRDKLRKLLRILARHHKSMAALLERQKAAA